MACDPNTLLEQAKCFITCIPPGMYSAANMALLCQIAENTGGGSGLYVLKAGDTMTGALHMAQPALVASDPAIDIVQTWNNAGVAFNALLVSITNTASAGTASIFEGVVDGVSRFSVRRTGTVMLHRQTADTVGETLNLSKRGTTGSATAAIASGDILSSIESLGWDGTSQSSTTLIRTVALEAFTNTAHGSRIDFGVPAIGAIVGTTRFSLSATAINAQNGAAYQLNGVALLNPLTVYAAGTAYTLTNASAAVDFGTTDPIITVNAAGTYLIRAKVKVNLVGATFAANQTLTVKLRRTNNTATDLTNSTTTWTLPIVTTQTNTLAVIELPEVAYTTALTNDTIQIFADVGTLPSAGTVTISEASIVAIRTS